MDSHPKYADTVFRKYFSYPHRLIEIYNSVNDTHLPEDTPIDIVHMPDNILCKDRINDGAFVINDEIIVLLEQQSPVDENMPMRILLYISRLYEKYIESVDHGATYKKKGIKLPTPKFYVLYTGKDEDIPRKQITKLSDAFKVKESPFPLDLKVNIYHLDTQTGDKDTIMGESAWQYTLFIHQIHEELNKCSDPNTASNAAIAFCIRNDTMRQFFQENSAEVKNMLITEYNMDVALRTSLDKFANS